MKYLKLIKSEEWSIVLSNVKEKIDLLDKSYKYVNLSIYFSYFIDGDRCINRI